ATVLSLVRALETFGTQQLGVDELEAVVLEGPQATPELTDRLKEELGERFSTAGGPGPTLDAIAKGLALGGLERDKPAPDLGRPLAPPPELWDLVPRGEVAMLGAVVVCMGLWLWMSGTIAQNRACRAEEDNGKNAMLRSGDDARLSEEKKRLASEVNAV